MAKTGHEVIEEALSRTTAGNWLDAPAGYPPSHARAYLQGMQAAYQHALEMIPASDEPVMTPMQLRECVSFMHFYKKQYDGAHRAAASIYVSNLEKH